MALTLLEAAKISFNENKQRLSEIQTQFALSSPILSVLPFETISGSVLEVPIEEELPAVGIRRYNEGFGEGEMKTRLEKNTTSIIGGDIKVDREFVNEMGDSIRSAQERAAVRAISLSFDRYFIKGSPANNESEFAGLQARLDTGTQVVAAGSTSGGDALSLSKLDELYDQVQNPTHWVMPKALKTRLVAASRTTGVSGFVQFEPDELGRRITTYADLPIIVIDEDNLGQSIMPFNEPAPGGGSAQCSSVYLVSIAPGGLMGIQTRGMDVRDLGEMHGKPQLLSRVDWKAGIAVLGPKSIGRVWGIRNLPIVA